MELRPEHVEGSSLLIPFEVGQSHFPPRLLTSSRPDGKHQGQILVSDSQEDNWGMTIILDDQVCAFVLTRGWQSFVDWHNLEANDWISFYKRQPSLDESNYIIKFQEVEKRMAKRGMVRTTDVLEFKPENLLFEIDISVLNDLSFIRLNEDRFKLMFPGHQIVAQIQYKDLRLKLTDTGMKDWCMKLSLRAEDKPYRVWGGWDLFVEMHNLELGNTSRLYKPDKPLHGRHFLIEPLKRQQQKGGKGKDRKGKGIPPPIPPKRRKIGSTSLKIG